MQNLGEALKFVMTSKNKLHTEVIRLNCDLQQDVISITVKRNSMSTKNITKKELTQTE